MMTESVYLTFFGIFGLAPFRIDRNKSQPNHRAMATKTHIKYSCSRIRYFYTIFLILLILGLCFAYFFHTYYHEVPNESQLTRKIRISMKIAGMLTIVIIWANYCWKQSNMVTTVNTFIFMNEDIKRSYNDFDKSQIEYINFYVLIVIHVIINIANLITTYLSNEGFDVSILSNIFDFVICLHIFQYALLLAIIKTKYESLYSKLSELKEIYNGLQVYMMVISGKNKFTRTYLQLTTIRRNYSVLFDICDDISQLYGISILFSLTYAFGIIVYYSYLAISNSIIDIHEKSFIYTIDAVLPLIEAVLAVTAICVLANDVVAQVCYYIKIVYYTRAG